MNWGLRLQEKPSGKTLLVFVGLSWLGILIMFRGAIWGEAMVAPLDIPAKLYTNYKWIDPTAEAVPRNHYVIDIFDFDLPLTHLAHQGFQAREFPWWNPYSDGGRTLAMEPHLGVTDPLRFAIFHIPSFVMAFNWSRILQCFFSGVTMFALLRFLGFSQVATVLGALSFQFCGFQSSFFYPYIHTLPYYPLLWLVLAKHARERPALGVAFGSLVCAAIILGGSQQSHAYLALFLFCFVVAYGSCFRNEILKLLCVTGGAFLLACAIAAPILVPQIEIFMLSSRKVPQAGLGVYMLTGLLSVVGVFPWFEGSFRTLDLGKLVGEGGSGVAYAVCIGTPAMILALIAIFAGKHSTRTGRPEHRMALLLVFVYFVAICSTPLLKVLYFRSALLAVLGLVVLFATGIEVLAKNSWPNARRWLAVSVAVLSLGVVLIHIFAFFVYPRFADRILSMVLQRDAQNPFMPSAPDVRRFQVNNFPNEVTFKNPEPLLAFVGALFLLGFAAKKEKIRQFSTIGIFVCNLAPLLIFSMRSLPYSPIEYWRALLNGGPEQRKAISQAAGGLRLTERVPGRLDRVFPGTLPALYRIHSLDSYTSLPLRGPGQSTSPRDYNLLYVSEPGRRQVELQVLSTNQLRFTWANKQNRDVVIAGETLNSIRLRIPPGAAGELVRTDTYYPGWRVDSPVSITQRQNSDGFLAFSIPPEATELVLRYEPSWSNVTKPLSVAALTITGLLLASSAWRRARHSTAAGGHEEAAPTQRA